MLKCIKTRFFTTPDIKKNFLKHLILVVWKCIKTHFLPFQTIKNILFDSGGLEMHKNTFLTTPDVKKYIF